MAQIYTNGCSSENRSWSVLQPSRQHLDRSDQICGRMLCGCSHREEQEYESEIRRQRDELEELSAERQRLLMMQQHLLKLQESLAAATDAAVQVSARSMLYAGVTVHSHYAVLRCATGWLRGTVGRTSVFDRPTFLVLHSTCSWWVTTYVGKPSAVSQPTRPTAFYPFGVDKWVVGCI